MNGINDALCELERVYIALVPMFKLDLPRPVITIQSRGRRENCLAWFNNDRWQNAERQPLCEINVCAEALARPVVEIAATMTHEICHQANWFVGINDCSTNQYHNARFRERAESVGLVCTKSRRGWAQTTASAELLQKLSELRIDAEAFSLYRLAKPPRKAPTSNLKKYTCGCSNFWAKAAIYATCQTCNQPFILVG